MASPTTVPELLDLVRKSGIIDEKRLDSHLEKLRAANALPTEPGKLAGILLRDGILTRFQAEQFMQGKWRRFTIGKYKVLEQLGSGGMGSVYLCEHMLMRRRVAVKVLPSAKAEDPASLERFYREARAVAALDHPNIVRAYDIDQDEKLHFLVMEYVDGASLQEIIKKTGPMDVTRAAHYIRQSAFGLQHAHETAGLVHRDIKPGNILVDRNGIVKVLDMGLARFFHDTEDVLTKKYDENVLGTADYLAPEQALDSHSVDIRADIYSLGATFYFCLTGRTPFSEGTVAQKLIWHQTRQPKAVRSIRPEVDEGLVAVLDRMMAKDPAQRYATPIDVAEALAPWTKTAIPPPPDLEMPQLSPAAMAGSPGTSAPGGDSGANATMRPTTGQSPAPRRAWQQAGATPAPTQAAVPQPLTARSIPQPPRVTPAPKPAAPPPPATTPSAKPAPVPAPPAVAPAMPAPAPAPPVPAAAPGPARPSVNSLLQATPVAPKPAPVQAITETPPENAPSWEQIATDTADITGQLDTPATRSRKRLSLTKESGQNRLKIYLLITLLGIGLIAAGIVAWLMINKQKDSDKDDDDKTKSVRATTLYVGDGEKYDTVSAAMAAAEAGDTIVVKGPELRDQYNLQPRNARRLKKITIRSEAGNTVWRAPNRVSAGWPLLYLEDADGWVIQGFTFEGGPSIGTLIQLACGCRDVQLKDLVLRGFSKTGIEFFNVMAPDDGPVVLSNIRADSGATPPVQFEVKKSFANHPRIDNVIVEDTCKFTGAFKIKLISLNAGDTDGVKLPPGLPFEKTVGPPK